MLSHKDGRKAYQDAQHTGSRLERPVTPTEIAAEGRKMYGRRLIAMKAGKYVDRPVDGIYQAAYPS